MYTLTQFGCIEDGNGATLPPANNGTQAWEDYQAWLDAGNTPSPFQEPQIVNTLTTEEAQSYLKGYYVATQELRKLAGITVPDHEFIKLEDSQYQTTLNTAIQNNAASPLNLAIINALCSTILYTFTQLTLKLQISWNDFTYDGSY